MEQKIEHCYLDIRGLSLHVAHIGKGEKGTVLFLHGFPEIWYTWRHQMVAVADAGYRAIAPDCRGYGLSESPKDPENARWDDLVYDIIAILDSLQIPTAFIIGKDFGVVPAFHVSLHYPDRVSGVVTLGFPYSPKGFDMHLIPKDFYMWRWREPGRAEADFGRFDVKTVIRNIYILFSGSELPIAAEGQEIMDLVEPSTPLPSWFTEDDLQVYADLYDKSGFNYALQIPYRSVKGMKPMEDPKLNVPAMLIMGKKDYCLKFPGVEDYIMSGTVKNFVSNLEVTFIPEGCHFVHEQFPDEVNKLIIAFLNSRLSAGEKA